MTTTNAIRSEYSTHNNSELHSAYAANDFTKAGSDVQKTVAIQRPQQKPNPSIFIDFYQLKNVDLPQAEKDAFYSRGLSSESKFIKILNDKKTLLNIGNEYIILAYLMIERGDGSFKSLTQNEIDNGTVYLKNKKGIITSESIMQAAKAEVKNLKAIQNSPFAARKAAVIEAAMNGLKGLKGNYSFDEKQFKVADTTITTENAKTLTYWDDEKHHIDTNCHEFYLGDNDVVKEKIIDCSGGF